MGGEEPPQPRHQPFGSQAGGCADDEEAVLARAIEPPDRVANALEPGVQTRIDEASRAGQLDRAAASMKQRDAQLLLQSVDLMAERSRRHVQLIRRLGETEVAGNRLEGFERIERRQGARHMSYSQASREIISFVEPTIQGQIAGQGRYHVRMAHAFVGRWPWLRPLFHASPNGPADLCVAPFRPHRAALAAILCLTGASSGTCARARITNLTQCPAAVSLPAKAAPGPGPAFRPNRILLFYARSKSTPKAHGER